jgi:hypothetical protein
MRLYLRVRLVCPSRWLHPASDSESIFLSGKRNTATWSRSVWEWETSNGEDSDATSTDWSVRQVRVGGRSLRPVTEGCCRRSHEPALRVGATGGRRPEPSLRRPAALGSDSASDAAGHGRWLLRLARPSDQRHRKPENRRRRQARGPRHAGKPNDGQGPEGRGARAWQASGIQGHHWHPRSMPVAVQWPLRDSATPPTDAHWQADDRDCTRRWKRPLRRPTPPGPRAT